jgi:CBS domain containing-hemolysin-like protein
VLLSVSGFLYIALLLLLAVISATETAIHTARDLEEKLEQAGEGSVARKLRSITANPFAQLHRTLLLSATLNLALAALGLHLVSGPLLLLGWNPWLTAPVLFMTTVLVGDVMPKFFAAYSPSAVLLGSLRLLNPLRSVLDPIVTLADRTTDALIRKLVSGRVKMKRWWKCVKNRACWTALRRPSFAKLWTSSDSPCVIAWCRVWI